MRNLVVVYSPPKGFVGGTVMLPASKSLSNRALIIKALCEGDVGIKNLSEADDTLTLARLLELAENSSDINAGHTGTAMRFLTSYLATRPGIWHLTGSERMKQRPIAPLVSALEQLGAEISYLETTGFPPLKIKGKRLKGGKITVQSNISSQFISSLLLVAPIFDQGLEVTLEGRAVSTSYIKMTLGLMSQFGIQARWERNKITIPAEKYQAADITIEPDWSAASYFYEILLLCQEGELFFPGLQKKSLQGDEIIWQWFEHMGINTRFTGTGAFAQKKGKYPEFVSFNFSENPDLAQTLALAFACSGIQGVFKGLETLPYKETDRVKALQNELDKIGFSLAPGQFGTWNLRKTGWPPFPGRITFNTYNDHRMAMACAPLALKLGQIAIIDPKVVTKSFPGYWENLSKLGFILM